MRGDLSRSLWDGVCFSLMVGLGEAYLPAFALALGHGEVRAGLVASVPMMIGGVLQLATPRAVHRLGSNRRWVALLAGLQALVFLPLAWAAWRGALSPLWLFAAAACYWATGLGAGPAWTSWFPRLVPQRVRSRYFGYRTRAAQAAVLTGLLGGGLLLQYAERREGVLLGFATIFALAGLFRGISTRLLVLQSEPAGSPPPPALPLRKALGRMGSGEMRRLFGYLLAVQVSVHTVAPYFTPYMLGQLQLGYGSYVLLVATAYLARAAALPLWGALAQRIGSRRLLWIGGVGIAPAALPWALTDSVGWLVVSQIAAGSVWAAYELGTFLVLFEHLPDEERTSLLTTYNLANAVALATGSLLGATVLANFAHSAAAYTALFSISTALRCATLWILPPVPVAPAELPLPVEALGSDTIAVRPSMGGIDRPILSEHDSGSRPI